MQINIILSRGNFQLNDSRKALIYLTIIHWLVGNCTNLSSILYYKYSLIIINLLTGLVWIVRTFKGALTALKEFNWLVPYWAQTNSSEQYLPPGKFN